MDIHEYSDSRTNVEDQLSDVIERATLLTSISFRGIMISLESARVTVV